ncbi:MAG: dihydroorotase [Pseudomarimonas sp.]
MNRWLIRNASLINEGRKYEADLRVVDGRIERIDPILDALPDEQVVDAGGLWLLPGMIDDQVHFREPGFPHKGDMHSESGAAVAGGITSFMDMPNTKPPTLDADAIADKCRRAAGRAWANYGFYHGASNTNLEAIQRIDARTTPGLKIFMGASTGNMLVDDPAVLEAMFRDCPVPIITHCEDTPTIEALQNQYIRRYGENVPVSAHPDIRSHEACYKSTELAIALARKQGARLHVLHISTANELALFEPGPITRKRITAETCIHFLLFDRADYETLGNLIKCNPAIKDANDRAMLIRALAEDRIDVLATDHAPHTLEEKQRPYLEAPSGLPLVQHAVVGALELVRNGLLKIETAVQKMCHAPAQLFDVEERGFLREGYFADLVLVDPNAPFVVERSQLLYRCGWSPFEDRRFHSKISATWVNGYRVWDGERLCGEPVGERLTYRRH